MKRVPKSLTVLGKKIQIVRVPLEDCHGAYKHDSALIELDTALPEDRAWQVLLHEMVHAYLTISGVAELMDIRLEEAVCRALENISENVQLKRLNA